MELEIIPRRDSFRNQFQDPCQIYDCTFFCPVQGLSNQICLSFRMADHGPTRRIKKILLHPSKHAKHELSKTTSPTQNSQDTFQEIIALHGENKKRWASLSENLAGWVLSSLHGPGDMPPFESQRLPRKYCAAAPIRSVAPRIDRAPKHGHLSCPYIWWSSKSDLCLVKKVRFANLPGKKKTSRRLWIYHVREEKREQKIQGFSKTRCHRWWSCSPVAPWNLSVGGVEYAFALALAPTFLCMIFRCEAAEIWKNPEPMFWVFLWGSMPFSLRSHVWHTGWCPWNCPPLPTGNDLLTSSLVSIVERITKSDRKSRIVPLMVKVDRKNAAIVEAESVMFEIFVVQSP